MMVKLIVPFLALCAAPVTLAFVSPSTPYRTVSLVQQTLGETAKKWRNVGLLPFVAQQQPNLKRSSLFMSDKEKSEEASQPRDELIFESSSILQRISWLSWWSQAILTVVSSVTLLFARNVVRAAGGGGGEGLIVAGSGLIVSFASILWTWGGARLGQRLIRKNMARVAAANMIRRCISVGITINLAGMALALVGAEQIVGSLAIKVLTQQGVLGGLGDRGAGLQSLQPLDILVVQGNTNTLLSHFCSIVAFLYLTKLVKQLDPPSTDGDERKRVSAT